MLVSKGVTSQEYDTPILALLEGNNYKGAALKKKKWENSFFVSFPFFLTFSFDFPSIRIRIYFF